MLSRDISVSYTLPSAVISVALLGPDVLGIHRQLHHWKTGGTRCSVLAIVAQAKAACGIYVASLTVLFTASALYHRRTWTPSARLLMKRVDHAAIFVLIAGARPAQECLCCAHWDLMKATELSR